MKKYYLLVILFFAGFLISAINPNEYFTWILEVLPAVMGFIVLLLTFKKFRFTYFTYLLILLHCYVLFIGGHYTYAQVPLFNLIKDVFHQSRNNYDKLGHFLQGFVPAFIVMEIFIRKQVINTKGWQAFLTVCVCAAISMFYEFIEWFISVNTGSSGDAFLGTQGYIWDTQSDMLFAVIGATCAVLFFAPLHNRLIAQMQQQQAA